MRTTRRALIAVCIAATFGRVLEGQNAPSALPGVPVITVCEALQNLGQYDGKLVVVVGELLSSDEGHWLREACDAKIVTDGYTWPSIISVAQENSDRQQAPTAPSDFNWDAQLLLTKLRQVRREAKPEEGGNPHWLAVFGRFETRLPLQVVSAGQGNVYGYGFGHLDMAPAQLISEDNSYRALEVSDDGAALAVALPHREAEGSPPIPITLCELVQQPYRYRGKTVRLRANVYPSVVDAPTMLLDRTCSARVRLDRQSPYLQKDEAYQGFSRYLHEWRTVEATVSGRFDVRLIVSEEPVFVFALERVSEVIPGPLVLGLPPSGRP